MDMVSAEVATKLQGFFNGEMGKILVTEDWGHRQQMIDEAGVYNVPTTFL